MRYALTLHPDSRCAAVARIEVKAARPNAGTLVLSYWVTGRMDELRLPPTTAAGRADELWRRTCFEAFVRTPPGSSYYEFNLAPSRQWAAYAFCDYRSGRRPVHGMTAPHIEIHSNGRGCELRAKLQLDAIRGLSRDAVWRLGLSAVIEEAIGRKSYWALAHPPGKPDFHHSDCFVQELPAGGVP